MLYKQQEGPSSSPNMHSVNTLLGRPVHQLVNANIYSANHVAATKCIKACRCGREVPLFLRSNVRKKCDPSDFDRAVIVGARQGGLSISETADLLAFSRTTVSRICIEWCEKHPESSSSAGRNASLMRGQRRRARLLEADRKVTVMQITNSGMHKSISEQNTSNLSKWIGHSSNRLKSNKSLIKGIQSVCLPSWRRPTSDRHPGLREHIDLLCTTKWRKEIICMH